MPGRRPEALAGAVATTRGAGPDERYLFARPTDVTWDTEGNIFVTDGCTNHRLVKYSPEGRYLGQVGSGQRGSGPDQFSTPHTIVSDDQGNIYVGDRGNRRVNAIDCRNENELLVGETGNWRVQRVSLQSREE